MSPSVFEIIPTQQCDYLGRVTTTRRTIVVSSFFREAKTMMEATARWQVAKARLRQAW